MVFVQITKFIQKWLFNRKNRNLKSVFLFKPFFKLVVELWFSSLILFNYNEYTIVLYLRGNHNPTTSL